MPHPIDVNKEFASYFKGSEALAYALSVKLREGNICLDICEYKEELKILLEEQRAKGLSNDEENVFLVAPEEFEKQCEAGKYVTHSDQELKPFVVHQQKAYLHRYFQYETQIKNSIEHLGNRFHIITGGPGTGKTYSVAAKLIQMFTTNPNLMVAMGAPTGKAAARMNEAVRNFTESKAMIPTEDVKEKLQKLQAKTIHLLLGAVPNSAFFKYNECNKLPHDVVIIDECSMIDGAMMAKLLNAIDDHTEVYLLGDKDQLASVEAGSVFGDLCRAKDAPLLMGKVEVKTESFRFDSNLGIGKISKEIIEGTFNDIESYAGDEQVTIELLKSDDPKSNLFRDIVLQSDLFNQYALEYKEYIQKSDIKEALKSISKIRFLCVTRENDFSVAETNKAIEKLLKEKINDDEKFDPKEGCYHNQPIIITQNDYSLGVVNGDVGLIRNENGILFAYFEDSKGEIRKIPAGYLNNYDTVFAMTIHKSQGSEFDHVVVLLPEKQGGKLLTRELLYTAVTRAKKKVLIQSTKDTLLNCVSRNVSRASGLEQRIKSKEDSKC